MPKANVIPLLIVLSYACSGNASRTRQQPIVPDQVNPEAQAALLSTEALQSVVENVTLKAWGSSMEPDEANAWVARILKTPATSDQLLDHLVADERFVRGVARNVVTEYRPLSVGAGLNFDHVLRKSASKAGEAIYYLREPCSEKKAERVHPWWNPASTVLVCPDSHRPKRLKNPSTATYCGGESAGQMSGNTYCGCGPMLALCFRDGAQLQAANIAMRSEVSDTFASIIERGQPLSDVYTTKATKRTRMAEFYYRRPRVMDGEDPQVVFAGLDSWSDTEPVEAERFESYPGMHAGILTTQSRAYLGAPRKRIHMVQNELWCSSPESVVINTHEMVLLSKNSNLREHNEGQYPIANMPACSSCHARMDYAMDFFSGWPSARASSTHVSELAHPEKVGKFFVNNLGDARGEAKRTPQNWARWAVSQPEFPRCMSERISTHFFGLTAEPEDLRAVEEVFSSQGGRLRPAFREGLGRYYQRLLAESLNEHEAVAPPQILTSGTGRLVALPMKLAEELEDACGACHFDGGQKPYLDLPTLSLTNIRQALDAVSFHQMPKAPSLISTQARESLVVDLLAVAQFADMEAAMNHFSTGPMSVHRAPTLTKEIAKSAGASSGLKTPMLEPAVLHTDNRLSPSIVAISGIEALRSCQNAKLSGEALAACVQSAARAEKLADHPLQLPAKD